MRIEIRPLATAFALVAASAWLAACEVNLNSVGLSVRETRTYEVTGPPDLTLDTFDGAIELHSWDKQEIEVEIEKRAMEQSLIDQITVEAEQTGNTIALRVKGPSRREFSGVTIGVNISPSARLRVVVPRSLRLQATSGEGSIRAEDLAGTIALHTRDGSITASRLSGDLEIRSGDGALRLEKLTGRVTLETDDGSIRFDGAPTVLRAKTGDGTIRARVDADTAMADNWDLTTGDGSIVLTLPSSFSGELDAETRDGSVRANHPLLRADAEGPDEDRDARRERRRSLHTKMGDGGKLLRLRTGDGSIRIES